MKRFEGFFMKQLREAVTRDEVEPDTADTVRVKGPDTKADLDTEVDPEAAEENQGKVEAPADMARVGKVGVKVQERRSIRRRVGAEVRVKKRMLREAGKEAKVMRRF